MHINIISGKLCNLFLFTADVTFDGKGKPRLIHNLNIYAIV